jgi:DNA-binding NarL/FixJ family response regulator
VKKIRILVADDHELIRRGVIELLRRQPQWKVVGEAVHGQEAVEKAKKLKPDVIILDISMPRLDGLEATRRIREAVPESAILILTMHDSEQMVRRVLQAGAKGYILKSDLGRRLVAGVKAVASGKRFLSHKVSEIVYEHYLKDAATKSFKSPLSEREVEITTLLATGKSNKEIATSLGIAVRTVETHRANIMRKLDLHSSNELVRYAIRSKMVEP